MSSSRRPTKWIHICSISSKRRKVYFASILRAYKAAFELASIPLELWVCRLVWL